jgi:hypothetical protein
MIQLSLTTFLAALAAGASDAPQSSDAVHGRYLEARSAALLAGACHYGGELATDGRAAVVGLAFEGGRHAGVELAGLELALVVEAEASLAVAAPRRALAFAEPEEREERVRAALGWLAERGLAPERVELERATLALETTLADGEGYRLLVGPAHAGEAPRVALEGRLLPDRRCCAMPLAVWYDPLVPLAERVVGCSERFDVALPRLELAFRRSGENDAFVGRFADGGRFADWGRFADGGR